MDAGERTAGERMVSQRPANHGPAAGRTSDEPVACPACGAEGSGNYCARCGARLAGGEEGCRACGAALSAGALFCAECGEPVGHRPRKPARAYLPWILSALGLVVFAGAIAVLVRGQAAPRGPDGLITGGLPEPSRAPAEVVPAPGAADGGTRMPSAAEIAAMTPREAADRLFGRALAERERGDSARARFFAAMAVDAYGRVAPADLGADARFQLGLLYLLLGDVPSARAEADALLRRSPEDLFGLVLSARAARAEGDEAAVARWYGRLRAAIASGETPDREPYADHREFLEREAEP